MTLLESSIDKLLTTEKGRQLLRDLLPLIQALKALYDTTGEAEIHQSFIEEWLYEVNRADY